MAASEMPLAAASTIRARGTSRWARRGEFARLVSCCRSSMDKMITNGEEMITIKLSRNRSADGGRHAARSMISPDSLGQDRSMAKIPTSTQTSLWQRLTRHSRQRWPQIAEVQTRYRAGFAYIDAVLADGEPVRLCRLRYGGSF
jgi:hypothetical protein